jgi:hypothetical protein
MLFYQQKEDSHIIQILKFAFLIKNRMLQQTQHKHK